MPDFAIGIPIGTQPVSISGMELWPLTRDEAIVLSGYRLVKQQRSGSIILHMTDGIVDKWQCLPDVGGANVMNSALTAMRRLRE